MKTHTKPEPGLHPFTAQDTRPIAGIPWNITQVNAPSFWPHARGGGAVVAVIDTGLDVTHKEFAGRIVAPRNFTSAAKQADVTDTEGHGTHVAGIIAGATCGVAPEARIMPLKVFGDSKVDQNIIDAFNYIFHYNETCPEKDRVVAVNCSFGAGFYDAIMAWSIRRLVNSGVAVVVAAGNQGDGDPSSQEIFSFPAYIWEVVTTAATNRDEGVAGYSNSFDGIDLAAPGTDIYSAWPGGGYKLLSGTSMAAPHVSGALALIYAQWRLREGRWPDEEQAFAVLLKHTSRLSLDPALVGRGMLDLSFVHARWPLHRVQVGTYWNKSGAESTAASLRKAGFKTYLVKY